MVKGFRHWLAVAFYITFLIVISGCGSSQQHGGEKSWLGSEITVYVSPKGNDSGPGTKSRPVGGLAAARDLVREIIADDFRGRITVLFQPGEYVLDGPVVFDNRDSGAGVEVRYVAAQLGKVVFTGGMEITGWKEEKPGLWYSYIADVHNGSWYFRQLFANGKRLTRARYPNDGYIKFADTGTLKTWDVEHTFKIEEKLPFENLAQKDAEAVMLHHWSISRKRIRESDEMSFTTEFAAGWVGAPLCEVRKDLSRMYFEHAREFLDVPGEWYLDRDNGMVYYVGAAGENPNDMTFIAPRIEKFLIIRGTKERPVKNLIFEGLDFEYAKWQIPLAGHNGTQAGCYGYFYQRDSVYMLPAVVHLEHADNCRFERCKIAHTCTSGMALGAGCDENTVIGCEFYDIGGNGIVNGFRSKGTDIPRRFFEEDWDDRSDAPRGNVFVHNNIHRCGQVFFGCVGYQEAFVTDSVLAHNAIYDLPYSGVSTGFTWNDVPTTQRNSRIEFNHIHDVMTVMHDGGGIYTLGYQPGTVIRNNLIEDVPNGHGLYTDYSSCRIVMENNIINRAGVYGYQHHYGHNNIVRNNIFASCGTYAIHHARDGSKPSFYFTNNIVYMDRFAEHGLKWYKLPEGHNGEAVKDSIIDGVDAVYDSNVYWDRRDTDIRFAGMSFEKWQQERGHDRNSIIADPMFADPSAGDFSMPNDSPAVNVGFKPINISRVGPQGIYAID